MITGAGHVLKQRLRRRWQRWADAVAPPPLILMYHRIAADTIESRPPDTRATASCWAITRSR